MRAALAQVQSGAAPVGVVYATDAARANGVRVLLRAGAAEPDIRYGAGVLSGGGAQAHAFVHWLLTSEAAHGLLEAHGFALPPI